MTYDELEVDIHYGIDVNMLEVGVIHKNTLKLLSHVVIPIPEIHESLKVEEVFVVKARLAGLGLEIRVIDTINETFLMNQMFILPDDLIQGFVEESKLQN